MKNILIFYGSYGGGHYSAAKSIADCIEKNYSDSKVEIIDCIEYINRFINKVTTRFYSGVAKNAPKMWGKIYYNSNTGVLSKVSNTANKIMARKLLKLVLRYNTDLVISTHPFSSNMCAYLKYKNKLSCKLATVITDYALHNQWLNYAKNVDYFFVSNEKMKSGLLELGVFNRNIFVTGIPISPRFNISYDKNEIFKELNLSSSKKTVLFFAGGEYGLGKHLTEKVFETIISNFRDLQVIAIAGKNIKIKNHFEDIVKNNAADENVRVLPFTTKVPEFMHISDFVVSKPGGLTTSECLASLLPLFIISPLPGQEEDNARFIETHYAGYWLKDAENINSKLDTFISNLSKMKESCAILSKKGSTNNICEILIKD